MSTIITKNSATSGSIPSSLVQGELAINVTDGRLFYGSGSGNDVKEFGVTASYALNALSASYAQTASFAPAYLPLTGGTIDGDLIVNGTASITYLNTTYESASIIYSSGSNQFGDASNDTQTLWGTVDIKTGPVLVTGSILMSGSSHISGVDYIDFDTTASATQPTVGRLSWNDTDGTLDLGLKGGNVTLQVGQESVIRVVNKTGGNLLEADFKVVRVRSVSEGGAQGQRLAVVLAQADSDADSATTLGVVTENILDNEEGFITIFGQVRGIDTTGAKSYGGLETWVDGDMLYLSPTHPGYLTNVKPISPDHLVIVGYVEYAHQNNGKIFVKIDNGWELGELHDVLDNSTSSSYGDLLVKSGSVWTNSKQLTGSYDLTGSLTATSFTGSLQGTASWANNAQSASYVLNAVSASFASTASFVNPLRQDVQLTGSMFSTGSRFTFRTTGTVDAVTITGSTGAYANSIMTINGLNQGNQNGLRIINLGAGDSGILIQPAAGGDLQFTGNSLYQTNRNFTFTTNNNAFDSSGVSYTFTDFNKSTTHQKSFLIRGSTNAFKSGSYFEVQKSGSIPILHLSGDAQSGSFSPNELYISGSLRVNSGNSVITGSLTVNGSTTSTQIGAGAAPSGSIPLDVRAQGALSTDLAFRVRNTANDRNLIGILGNGDIEVRTNRVSLARSQRINIGGNNTDNAIDATAYDEIVMLGYNNTNANFRSTILGSSNSCNVQGNNPAVLIGYGNTSSTGGNIVIGRSNTGQASLILGASNTANGGGNGSGIFCIGNSNTVSVPNGFPTLPMFLIGSNLTIPNNSATNNCVFLSAGSGSGNPFVTIKNDNLLIGTLTPWTANFDNNSRGTFYAQNGIAPTTLAADSFGLYSADRNGVAGKASPHFRTEDGSILWLGDESRLFNLTASRTTLSASNATSNGPTLTVIGSGSAQPVFTVQGSQGELFSVTDSLSGSLFSVNDISGLPILEVFSDNTTLMGSYLDPMLITTTKVTQTNSGSFVVYSLPTASYDTAFFEYSIKSGSNARAGTIMAIQSGTSVNFTETTTTDFGDTTPVSFTVVVTGSNMALTGSSTTGSWTIKTIIRGI